MYGILRMPHMVSVDKYTVNCKEILVEYYFNISLFSQTALCEIYLRFSLFEAKNCLFLFFILWLVAGMRARAFTRVSHSASFSVGTFCVSSSS